MKSLQESLLDDENDIIDNVTIKVLIKDWLNKHSVKSYRINKDNTITCNSSVYLYIKQEDIPEYIKFKQIKKNLSILGTDVTSLRCCPEIIHGDFFLFCENLKSLEGAPKIVEGYFECCECTSLTSLEGGPKSVGEYFDCSHCENLTSFKGAPEIVGSNMRCIGIPKVKSLKGFPKIIKGSLWIPEQFNEQDIRKISNVYGDVKYYKLNIP